MVYWKPLYTIKPNIVHLIFFIMNPIWTQWYWSIQSTEILILLSILQIRAILQYHKPHAQCQHSSESREYAMGNSWENYWNNFRWNVCVCLHFGFWELFAIESWRFVSTWKLISFTQYVCVSVWESVNV